MIVPILLAAILQGPASWVAGSSGAEARLRGLDAVDDRVAWASGAVGTVVRTVDGDSWRRVDAPEPGLDYRDVEAIDADAAYLLSIGEGPSSRLFKTTDGGASWSVVLANRDAAGFFDAAAFRDERRGLVLGDPVDGSFTLLRTADGGGSWERVDPDAMPPSLPGEAAFAASGSCLVILGDRAWFCTGGAEVARVFRSEDGGRSWTAHPLPIAAGVPSAGAFALAFRDPDHGVAVGGDYLQPDGGDRVVALTDDGGRTWRLPAGPGPAGYRSDVAFVPGDPSRLVAVGPSGTDGSSDGGESWEPIGVTGFHAIDERWAVGDDGRVARLMIGPRPAEALP